MQSIGLRQSKGLPRHDEETFVSQDEGSQRKKKYFVVEQFRSMETRKKKKKTHKRDNFAIRLYLVKFCSHL